MSDDLLDTGTSYDWEANLSYEEMKRLGLGMHIEGGWYHVDELRALLRVLDEKRARVAATQDPEVLKHKEEMLVVARERGHIPAIKELRERTGIPLRVAKLAMDIWLGRLDG